jgi:hypothetical protein
MVSLNGFAFGLICGGLFVQQPCFSVVGGFLFLLTLPGAIHDYLKA